ncbi:MAG TPA: transposase [Pseudonocardiaceae bacterium]|nr:transposase [Pseudonocardiaceae bacterium]
MTAAVEAPPDLAVDNDVPDYCRSHLSSLARADQRRWGEAYVRGLVTLPGRKSIRRIADEVVGGRADQNLQQFVNQSTWKWDPVRRSLAGHVTRTVRPRAWVVMDAVFPKNGSSSVGVARQYVASAGKVLNCQLGLALCLVGEQHSCPVDWRLLLPPCWDRDLPRRERTHLPDNQHHQPRWRYLLSLVDEAMLGWHLRPAPLLTDATAEPDLEPLLHGLEQRGLGYLVRVSAAARVTRWPSADGGRTPTAGEIAAPAGRNSASVVWRSWTGHHCPTTRILAAAPSRPAGPWFGWPQGTAPQQVVVRWSPTEPRTKSLWLTNLGRAVLPDLAGLLDLYGTAADGLADMADTVGLQHFEGRSFPGWHHHVTLASMAYAYTLGRSAPVAG